jgi:hypothetical protein
MPLWLWITISSFAVLGIGSLIALGIAQILGAIADGISELEADWWASTPLTADADRVTASLEAESERFHTVTLRLIDDQGD